jgi:hypothetical protein
VVEVYRQTPVLYAGNRDHLLGIFDRVADGFLAQHVAPGAKSQEYGLPVIRGVLEASCGDAAQLGMYGGDHVAEVGERWYAEALGRRSRPFRDDVADADEVGVLLGGVDVRV